MTGAIPWTERGEEGEDSEESEEWVHVLAPGTW
jgi:hypothetical protein